MNMMNTWSCCTVIAQIQATACDNMTQATGQATTGYQPMTGSNISDHFCDVEMILSASHLTGFYMGEPTLTKSHSIQQAMSLLRISLLQALNKKI